MRIMINRSVVVPLVDQIRDQVVGAISTGDLKPGDRLPPIRQLAEFLGINRNTVGQAYRLLEHEGYLATRAGGGTTIANSAAAIATRGHSLRERVRQALAEAISAGFTAQEFIELAYYEAAAQDSHRSASIVVIDQYPGELATLGAAAREALPGYGVQEMLLADIRALDQEARAGRLADFDFALVPFYCLEAVTEQLAGVDLPILAAGVGPSLALLRSIEQEAVGERVTIVCTDPHGPERMERSLRRAGINLAGAAHTHVGDPELANTLAGSDVAIASEGSVATVKAAAPGLRVITYSAMLNEASLATIRKYASRR